jgi:homopolymeric O-antigen transport system ATP-binding protein
MPPSILVDNVSKCYKLGETQHTMLADSLMGAFRSLVGGKKKQLSQEILWALKNVSLEVQPGEVIGLIGRNGAGKSTLLKILSRITYPHSGRVDVRGSVGSLIEVGTGFHEELTGRENIYLNGSILGMKKRQIDSAMGRIIEFADIGEFLDTPIKRYSSGMRMRLGFSVAAHLNTDVLFVDEVLAVGDAAFQKKCLGAMSELSHGGRTVIFVSHNMAAVENLCTRTIWIAGGKVIQDGDTREVIRAYLNSFETVEGNTLDLAAVRDRKGTGLVRFLKMEFLNDGESEGCAIRSGGPLCIRFHYECHRDIPNLHFGLRISSNLGALVSEVHTWSTNQAIDLARKGKGAIDLEIDFLNLMPGTYYAELLAASMNEYHDRLENVAKINVEPSDYYGTGRGIEPRFGLVFFPFRWMESKDIRSCPEENSPEPEASPQAGRDGRSKGLNCTGHKNTFPCR